MDKNKIFIFLPDGIGLRNFAFTNFHKLATDKGFNVTFWNNTPFPLDALGFKQKKITHSKSDPFTDLLKRARTQIDLNRNIKKSGDRVYDSYRFPFSYKDLKTTTKSLTVKVLSTVYNSESGVAKIRKKIQDSERKTQYYRDSIETLKTEKPAIVFCTNQRPLTAIAPLLASKDLGIPTAVFIFSWDNLPKATMVIETDYYFVWSQHMKSELLYYYPYINENQVFVTGTPQFEPHFNKDLLLSKADFFAAHQLDPNRKYICFSGDDVTTSPNDPQFLADTVAAIRKLNEKGHSLGIIFRRCPVDFSDRYEAVLRANKDILVPIAPKWEKMGENWNAVLPTTADLALQINTIEHTELVINLGSSMVFDYVAFGKPCMYLNYDVKPSHFPSWNVETIYKYVHFRSMPDKKAVIWINNPEEMTSKIENLLVEYDDTAKNAALWFQKINQHPVNEASNRILEGIKTIINK